MVVDYYCLDENGLLATFLLLTITFLFVGTFYFYSSFAEILWGMLFYEYFYMTDLVTGPTPLVLID